MNPADLLKELEAAGAVITIVDRLRCEVPPSAAHLLPALRDHRHDLARVLRGRLAESVRRWIKTRCVASSLCSSNHQILHREFSASTSIRCTRVSFVQELERCGFGLDGNGIVAGLALEEDFIAAIQYERLATDRPKPEESKETGPRATRLFPVPARRVQ